jgi:hypothetical protein
MLKFEGDITLFDALGDFFDEPSLLVRELVDFPNI